MDAMTPSATEAAKNGAKYGGISGGLGGVIAALITAFVTSWLFAERSRDEMAKDINGVDTRVAVIEGNRFTASDAVDFSVIVAQLNGRLDLLDQSIGTLTKQIESHEIQHKGD
jgi:hypothetical protein